MQFRNLLMLLGVGGALAAAGCGDSADGQTVELTADKDKIEWTINSIAPLRITDWVTYNTWQNARNPYDSETTDRLEPVGNVEIAYTVQGSNEAFDDPWGFDENGDRINPIVFLDTSGNEHTSPFITKTDDTGRYVLGLNTFMSACFTYKVQVEARVMGRTVSTNVEIKTDVSDNDLATFCSAAQ